jgi:NDP-sugar pyrophosphorylase family protein
MAIASVSHIFGGIPAGMIRPVQSPEANLSAITNRLAGFGVNIHPTCRIGYSTLLEMIETVNKLIGTQKPISGYEKVTLHDARIDQKELLPIINASGKIDLHINIGPMTAIGEYVALDHHLLIGPNSLIADNVRIVCDVIIGADCVIERGVQVSQGCRIGENTRIKRLTTLGGWTIVPPNSLVDHESPDCTTAKIIPRL